MGASVSGGDASVSGGPTAGGGTVQVWSQAEREKAHADARSCDPMGDITFKSTHLGTFSYGGLEFHLPTFTQCMLNKGYAINGAAGRDALTDFGSKTPKADVQGN